MLRRQLRLANPIMLLLFLSPAALLTALLLQTRSSTPAAAGGGAPSIHLSWSIPAHDIEYVTFSPDGRWIGVVRSGGTVECYKSNGTACCSAEVPGANRVVVAPGGAYAMAYARLNALQRKITFLDASGRVHWDMEVAGAVWAADVAELHGGARFVVGTGESYVYVIDIGAKRRKYKRWRVPGAVTSVRIDPEGERVIYGTWQESTVACAQTDGQRIWEKNARPARLHFIEPLMGSQRLLLYSIPNRSGADGDFALLDSKGDRIWQDVIDSAAQTRVLCSPNGLYVCLGYETVIEHEGKSVREKHASLFDSSGTKIWDKGSLFLSAEPLLVTSKGYVVVCTGDNSLFTISPSGDMGPSIKLPGDIESSTLSRDGRQALVQCSDGKLHLLKVLE